MHFLGKQRSVRVAALTAVLLVGALGACGKTDSAASLMAQAKQFEQKGDRKAAIIQLKNAVLKDPADAQARLMLGTLYLDTHDMPSAEKELRKAKSLGVSDTVIAPLLAAALLAQGQFQKVLDDTDAAAAATTKDERLLAARGDAYWHLGKLDMASTAYVAALAAKPGNAGALIGQARMALATPDVAGATALTDEAIAKNPQSADAWMFKGAMLSAGAKPDEALAAYDKVLAIDPEHRIAHVAKANVAIGLKRFDAAQAEIDAARKVAPNSPAVNFAQGMVDFGQGKTATALESLQKVLRIIPEHMPALLAAGACEITLGFYGQAEQHLKHYLEKEPDSPYARHLMASTLLKLGRGPEAMTVLAPALRGNGAKDATLQALAGEVSLSYRDFAPAARYFEQALSAAPSKASVHAGLAMSLLGQGERQRAVAELEIATKLDAGDIATGSLLAMTELELKHLDKALAAANALEQAHPKDPVVANLKGGVYMAKGDLASARASFDKAVQLQPDFYPAVANLANIAVSEGKPAVAKQLYLALLEKNKKQTKAMEELAALAAVQHQTAEVTQWREMAYADNPDLLGPALVLARHYLAIGEKNKALTLMRKLSVSHAGTIDVLDLLAQAQGANGDMVGALDTYSKLAAQAPKSAKAQLRLASVHILLDNEQAAMLELKKALALEPSYVEAQIAMVELAMRANKPEQAFAIAHEMEKQRPREAVGYVLEGDLHMNLRKPALALPFYDKAFALQPTSDRLIRIVAVMREAGRDKEADTRLAQWYKEHPADALVGNKVAEMQMAAKQNKAAIATLEGVLRTSPDDGAALNNLAWVYQQEKDARALATAERANQVVANNPSFMDTLAAILTEQGNTARAVPLLQKAVQLAPAAASIRFHLAEALVKAGDKAGARKELDTIIAAKNPAVLATAQALRSQL